MSTKYTGKSGGEKRNLNQISMFHETFYQCGLENITMISPKYWSLFNCPCNGTERGSRTQKLGLAKEAEAVVASRTMF